MRKHLYRDLENLKRRILTVGGMVERSLEQAVTALRGRRLDLAQRVIAQDEEIDSMEVEVEEEGLKILALHQPVAADLRFIVTVIKVNSDLERMGDHSVHIAERAMELARHDAIPLVPEFQQMVDKVREMVGQCLDALVNVDVDLSRRICAEDEEVDACLREMYAHLLGLMRADPATVERAVSTLSVCRNLERIADLATNVAEDVIFMGEGEIVRHRLGVS